MPALIEAEAVSKRFRQHRRFPGLLGALKSLVTTEYTEVVAVDEVSFSIAAGEAVGYLGPNGAGKSTMIKMLTGILVPTGGQVSVLGRTPHRERMTNAREIGVVFGQRSQLWWDLPVRDSFELHRRIYGIAEPRFRENLAYLSDLLDLAPFLDRAVRQLSLGQRMRAEIVMALLHDPKILFLDEPTIGLDVVAKDAVRGVLSRVNKERGVTVILTTHDLQDIEQVCPRLIMVDQSRLLFDGPLRNLRASLGSKRRLTLEFATDPGPLELRTARLVLDEGLRKRYLVEREELSILDVLTEIGADRDLKDVALEEPSIEEVIRTFYQGRAGRSAGLMEKYAAFAVSAFQTSLAYRNEVWANIFGKLVQVLARVAIWFAVYAGATAVDGVTLAEMVTYALLGGVVLGATRYDRVIKQIGTSLKTGDVAVWLLKPLHYPLYLLATEFGMTAYTFLMAVVPTIVVVALIYGMLPPATPFHGVMFVAYCLLSFLIHFLFAALFGLAAFWLMTAFSLEWLLQSLLTLLSGLFVPFWFFPEPFGAIASHLPLAWLAYYPSAVWLGRLAPVETLVYFGIGLGWALLLASAVTLLWRRASNRITVQGG